MPKTPVYEHRQPRSDKNYVRRSRQVFPMKPITKAGAMERPPKVQFRRGVALPNGRHHGRSFCFRNNVSQEMTLQSSASINEDHGFANAFSLIRDPHTKEPTENSPVRFELHPILAGRRRPSLGQNFASNQLPSTFVPTPENQCSAARCPAGCPRTPWPDTSGPRRLRSARAGG